MALAFAVDWIRATTKDHSIGDITRKFSYGFTFEDWIPISPQNGYEHGLKHPLGHTVMWSNERDDMGVNINFSGSVLNDLMSRNVDILRIVSWLSEEGFKFTRLDLALDIHGVEIDIVRMRDLDHVGSVNSEPNLVTSGKFARGGATLYLGSRKSDKYLRIYDKAKEQKHHDRLWTRVEIELKGRTATRIAERMNSMNYEGITDMTKRIILGMYKPDDETFVSALGDKAERVGSTKIGPESSYDWMMSSVSRTMAKLIIEQPHKDVLNTFIEEVHKHVIEFTLEKASMSRKQKGRH